MLALGGNARGKAGLLSILRPQDVFATVLRTGTDANVRVVNGLDLIGRGGSVKQKCRSHAEPNIWVDTARGPSIKFDTASTAEENPNNGNVVSAFYNNGYDTGNSGGAAINGGRTYVDWATCQADKFYKINAFTHVAGVASTIDLSSLGIVGQVTIKRRNAIGDWYVWHRSLTAGRNLRLSERSGESPTNAFISVSGTTVTFSSAAPAGQYLIEAHAHDPDPTNGMVQCGSYATNSAFSGSFTLPWPPQWLQLKPISDLGDWYFIDTIRGFTNTVTKYLKPNTSEVESTNLGGALTLNDTTVQDNGSFVQNGTVAWVAIRAPI